MAGRIYIIEDDDALAVELSRLLQLSGYEVGICDDFARAAQLALHFEPDCLLLDLKLPDADGRQICRDIGAASGIPVIVLTSANDEFTEVMCIKLGARDFIAKPYRPAALLARIEALVERNAPSKANGALLRHGGVSLDLNASTVSFEGRQAQITRNEQRILSLLMRNAGAIVSRRELMCDLWESDAFIDDNTLTVNVNRLRKTLAGIGVPGEFLQTRRSLGYVIEA